MLHEFLTTNTDELVALTRKKVGARTTLRPSDDELKNGAPLFLAQLVERLQQATTDSDEIGQSATLHGGELLGMGYNVSQVVHGYGDVCQAITELAEETDVPITIEEFNLLNRCLDDAIAHSVTEYERRRDQSIAYEGSERLAVLAHEMRNRVAAALVAFRILQEGTVAIGGSTGAVLGRSLAALRDLVDNSLAGVRLEAGLGQSQRVSLAELLGEVQSEASLAADLAHCQLLRSPVAKDVYVDADPQILSAAIGNLLQNAFKFSRPSATVVLSANASAGRIVIEVEDECGGLPAGVAHDLFQPFRPGRNKRSGLGLGLSISRRGIEAMKGSLSVRDLPGKGCVFSIDLPRLLAS